MEIRRELEDFAAAMRVEVSSVLAMRNSELKIARIREDSLNESISDLQERIVRISQNRLGLRQLAGHELHLPLRLGELLPCLGELLL